MTENEIGTILIKCATKLHRDLGPGLLESVYEVILAEHLRQLGVPTQRQVPIPIEYQGLKFEEGFRADLLIDGKVIVELKSVETVTRAHKKQVLTYLKLTGIKLGYLINFGASTMREGIFRIINGVIK